MIQKKPNIIFLSESLCRKEKVENVRKRIGFEDACAFDCQVQGGGLARFWRNKEEITIQSYSANHINAIFGIQGWHQFRLTGLYNEPNRLKCGETWNLIRNLHTYNQLPWVIIGDMNNVLGQADKRGGPLYPSLLINGFNEALEECDLHDMELQGYPFTWELGHDTDKWVEIRLDRAVASSSWLNLSKDARLVNLETSTSEHNPILLEPIVSIDLPRIRNHKFENAWLREPVCKLIVEDSWSKNQDESLPVKIVRCIEEVAAWGQDFTSNFHNRIEKCKKIIKNTKGRRDTKSIQIHQCATKELSKILTQQEIFWKQRSK